MMAILRQSVLSLVALVFLGLLSTAQADTSPIGVALDQRVIDLTDTLDASTTTRLKNQLADLEQRKGAQVAVLLVPTTGGASIEDYANQLFRAWKLGRKGVNDGVLLVVAKEDRKVRIEVGYGLEGTVTDLLAHRIIEEHITPAFRQGDFAGGVSQGVNDLVVLVDGGDLPKIAGPGANPQFIAIALAFVIGAIGGVLISAGRLHWRRALIAMAAVTVLLAIFGGGRDWLMFLLVLPLTLLIGGATFGALWMARSVFYGVVALLAYILGLVVVDQRYADVNFIHWLVFPLGALLALGLYLVLLMIMKDAWKQSRVGFIARLVAAVGVYVAAGMLMELGRNGWLYAFPIASFAALFIFGKTSGGSGSGAVSFSHLPAHQTQCSQSYAVLCF
ncbi:YgcG family protein [Pseudomonas simiae]|uniref:TPM domain-containing protein n=1 Tax=Pseudomonas simiae TaxID=321846 RepID=UPI001F42B3E5|nr:YgcG family protein [Pseudomonas simiae]MCF5343286.1 YgcG family protein [Pseudomonas simiae]